MRRKDKEITDRNAIDDIINRSEVLRLGLCKDNKPYIVPLSFGYDGKCLYFHSAREGMKIDYIKDNPNVCFEIENEVAIVKHESAPCDFTFSFRSVIGFGDVSEITNKNEKREALKIILSHYSDKEWNIPFPMLLAVRVWKVSIINIIGKQSKDKF